MALPDQVVTQVDGSFVYGPSALLYSEITIESGRLRGHVCSWNGEEVMRAEPFAPGGPESVALELYLAVRANGLPVETPAVRP